MNALSTTTIIVLSANTLTAVLSAALLMLVLWQAPHQRANQMFAFCMLVLTVYSGINGFSRFIEFLNVDPHTVFYLTASFYGIFVGAMFFFAAEFAQTNTPTVRAMKIIGVVQAGVQGVALWSGNVMTNIRPTEAHNGDFRVDYTMVGLLITGTLVAYLIASSITLYRMRDERGRSLWAAPFLAACSLISAGLIWPLIHIPLNAMFLAASAGVLGYQVLNHELFNPMKDLNSQLAQKNAELEEANRLETQFLTNMSHELRTPLNSIIGYTELVINGAYGGLNDTQQDRLEKVIRNGYNLLSLINDVLDLNKIEAGRFVLERRNVNTVSLLDSVLTTTIEPLANQKGLTITRDYADVPSIYADEVRARQILTNILSNAVKFTHQGGITVRAFRKGALVQFEITDTGIGIEADQIDLVFAEFRQIDSSSTRQYEGTGLGMAITRRLVDLHGGCIWLVSTPGIGTTFFVTLPVAEPLKHAKPECPPSEAVPTPTLESAKEG